MTTALKKIGEPERKRQKITQEQMAKKLSVSKTTYRKWVHRYPTEKGGKPNRKQLEEIADILGIDSNLLLEDAETTYDRIENVLL